ncbi:FecR family protein [Flagellimonas baculiformis]|uniref:FecR family protein n=1 Tax=Flagellimonas baculiformis TaxID=3067310 RepID=UPI00296F61FC|nr:FecR domain-containing protein [Muricauda sp. D6]
MDSQKRFEQLVNKFVQNRCSEAESKELVLLLQKKDTGLRLPSEDTVLSLLDSSNTIDETRANEIYQRILDAKGAKVKKSTFPKYWIRIAAAVLVLISLGIYITGTTSEPQIHTLEKLVNQEHIILEMEDGTIKLLDSLDQGRVVDVQGQSLGNVRNNRLTYDKALKAESLVYNTIKVPYGRKFELSLTDGTVVHVNAGSSLKYPVKFIDGMDRDVFLEGEAYFEVAHRSDQPFKVHMGGVGVEVLGTQFNITAFPENVQTDVVLVEGSVKLTSQASSPNGQASELLLEPGQMGIYTKNTDQMSSQTVITDVYTRWVDGELIFRNLTFAEMLKKLERHFNVPILADEGLVNREETFSANFGTESIDNVFAYLKEIYDLEYTIQDNKVIIH